jgi:CIC family chloride channel protein
VYAAVAMGAVFASAARAPLTSVASVIEMTGDYALTLPVMLAVAIAAATSRALSYGTIYTTKLLRRGQDVDRGGPWRAFADLTAGDAMRRSPPPFRYGYRMSLAPRALAPLRPERSKDQWVSARPPGRVPRRRYPRASHWRTLGQLAVYGRDGLPVLSGDGRQVRGWISNASVLQAVASQSGTPPGAAQLRGSRRWRPVASSRARCPATGYWSSPSGASQRRRAAHWAASACQRAASRRLSCATASSASLIPASPWQPATGSACSSRSRPPGRSAGILVKAVE